MSKGGGGYQYIPSVQSSNTNTSNNIPDWLSSASQTGINYAQNLLNNPGQSYTGELSPGMTADQTSAGNMIRNSIGAYQPYFNQAADMTQASTASAPQITPMTFANGLSGGANNYTNSLSASSPDGAQKRPMSNGPQRAPLSIADMTTSNGPSMGPSPSPQGRPMSNGPSIGPSPAGGGGMPAPDAMQGGQGQFQPQSQQSSGISQYMNPYISNVVNSVNALSNQNLNNALTQTGDQAISAHAFGGSRHGVQEGVATAQNNLNTNNLLSNLLSQGYTQASGLMGQDISNNLQAQGANQANANNALNRMQSAGSQLANIGTANRAANTSDITNLMAYGNQQQQTQAAQDQANYANYQYQNQMPYQALQAYNQTVQGAPHSTNGSSNTTSLGMQPMQQTSSSPLSSILGLGAMGLGAYFGGPSGAAAGSALVNGLLGGGGGYTTGGATVPYSSTPAGNGMNYITGALGAGRSYPSY